MNIIFVKFLFFPATVASLRRKPAKINDLSCKKIRPSSSRHPSDETVNLVKAPVNLFVCHQLFKAAALKQAIKSNDQLKHRSIGCSNKLPIRMLSWTFDHAFQTSCFGYRCSQQAARTSRKKVCSNCGVAGRTFDTRREDATSAGTWTEA